MDESGWSRSFIWTGQWKLQAILLANVIFLFILGFSIAVCLIVVTFVTGLIHRQHEHTEQRS